MPLSVCDESLRDPLSCVFQSLDLPTANAFNATCRFFREVAHSNSLSLLQARFGDGIELEKLKEKRQSFSLYEDKQRNEMLFFAARDGDVNSVIAAILAGAEVDCSQTEESSWPIIGYVTPLFIAAQNGHANVVAALIGLGKANVNYIPECAESDIPPLFAAVQNGSAETVEILLAGGADVEHASKDVSIYFASTDDITPHAFAILKANEQENTARKNIVELIEEHVAQTNIKCRLG